MKFFGSWEAFTFYFLPFRDSVFTKYCERSKEIYVTTDAERHAMIREKKSQIKEIKKISLKDRARVALAKGKGKKKKKARTASSYVHLHSTPLPAGSFIRGGDGRLYACPELAFVQMCYDCLNIHEAIMIGNCLCQNRGLGMAPLTTVAKLRAYVEQLGMVRGKTRAMDALTYLKDNYRSPMEVKGHMALALPHHLGGLGLSKFSEINMMFRISQEEADALGQKMPCLMPDFCYPEGKIAGEYQSKAFHSTPEAKKHDQKRKKTFEQNGFRVFFMEARDFYNPKRFDKLCREIAKAMGKTIRIISKNFDEMQAQLRSYLPGLDPGPLLEPNYCLEDFRDGKLKKKRVR